MAIEPPASPRQAPSRREVRRSSTKLLLQVLPALTLIGVILIARGGTLLIALDVISAAVIIAPLAVGGAVFVPWLRLGPLPVRWRLLLSAALGLGVAPAIILAAGSAGILWRWLFLAILTTSVVIGTLIVWRWLARRRSLGDIAESYAVAPIRAHAPWLFVLAVPFLVMALLAAAVPPGLSWSEEGFGYDILEYHLGVPKEYYRAGGIAHLSHNVYANFPGNVEMLYLLAMVVHCELYEIGAVANYIHLLFGVLTVFAAWVAAREWGALPGATAVVLLGTSGWLVYLCGLAYVEHGMLFFGMAAAAAALQLYPRQSANHGGDSAASNTGASFVRWAVIAGLFSGFACGCKYTAVAFIAVPMTFVVAIAPRLTLRRRAAATTSFILATVAAFSPWLIKNTVLTGNPVFPLANHLFDATPDGWSAESQRAWDAGHSAKSDESTILARVGALWKHVVADHYGRFSWAAIVLGILALWHRRAGRVELALGLMFFVQLLVWLFATHLYARFAIPMLIPLVLLSARLFVHMQGRTSQAAAVGIIVVAAGFHLVAMGRLFAREWPGVVPASVLYEGRVPATECLGYVNHELSADARVALLGEARAFYFHRDAAYWVAFNENPVYRKLLDLEPAAFVQWLGDQGYSHLYLDIIEVGRLDRTYGSVPRMSLPVLRDRLKALHDHGVQLVRVCPDAPGDKLELSAVFEVRETAAVSEPRP